MAGSIAVGLVVKRVDHARWPGPAALATLLFALAIGSGPLPLAVGLLSGWLGWVGRPPRNTRRQPPRMDFTLHTPTV